MIKTYEILKMVDKNPKAMIGKRFKQAGGLIGEEFGIGDIAIVTEYHGITSLGAEKFSRIRIDINGFEEWEEVKEKESKTELAMKYFEFKEPYYALIRAGNEDEAITLYKNTVADLNEDDLYYINEVNEKMAFIKYLEGDGETDYSIDEMRLSFNSDDLILIDGSLVS